jgi:hypothetical protein
MKIQLPQPVDKGDTFLVYKGVEYPPDYIEGTDVVFTGILINDCDIFTLCHQTLEQVTKQDYRIIKGETIIAGEKRIIQCGDTFTKAIQEVCDDIHEIIAHPQVKVLIERDTVERMMRAHVEDQICLWLRDHTQYNPTLAFLFQLYYERMLDNISVSPDTGRNPND